MAVQTNYALLEEVVDALVHDGRSFSKDDVPKLLTFLQEERVGNRKYITQTGLVTVQQASWIDNLLSENGNKPVSYETRKLPKGSDLPEDHTYLNQQQRRRWIPKGGLAQLNLDSGVYLTNQQIAELAGISEEEVAERVEKLSLEHAPEKYGSRSLITAKTLEALRTAPSLEEIVPALPEELPAREEDNHQEPSLELPEAGSHPTSSPSRQRYYLHHPIELVELEQITRNALQPDIRKGVYLQAETILELLGIDVMETPLLQQRRTLSDGNSTYYYVNGLMILALYHAEPSAKQGDLEKTLVLVELGLLEEETKREKSERNILPAPPETTASPPTAERKYLGNREKRGWLDVSSIAGRLQEPFQVVSLYRCWDFDQRYQNMRSLAKTLRKKKTFKDINHEHLIAQRGILEAEGFDVLYTGREYWLRWVKGDQQEIFAQIGFERDEQNNKSQEKAPEKKGKPLNKREMLEAIRQRVFERKHEPAPLPPAEPPAEETEELDDIVEEPETYDETPPEDDTFLGKRQMSPSAATSLAVKELLRETWGSQADAMTWNSPRRTPKKW